MKKESEESHVNCMMSPIHTKKKKLNASKAMETPPNNVQKVLNFEKKF